MKTKRTMCLIALCLIAVLVGATWFIMQKSTKSASSIPEGKEGSTLEQLKNMTQEQVCDTLEHITDAQLVEIADSPWGILIPDRHVFDTFSVDFLDGENGSPRESWYEGDIWLSGSVSSLEEAEAIALDFAESEKDMEYSVEWIGANDLYYQFRVIRGPFAYRINFYKDSVIRFLKGDSYNYLGGKTHYSFEDVVFVKLDYDTVLTVMDLENKYALYRYSEESDDEYVYTMYRIEGSGGDWGLNGTVSLTKTVTKISKTTGETESYTSVIKDCVMLPGSSF